MLVGSGLLTYTIPVASARTEAGQEAAPTAIGSYSKYTTTAHPNTKKTIKGWEWDNRIWAQETFENVAAYLPINWDPTTSGITQSYFQSGIGSGKDLQLMDIKLVPSSGLNKSYVYNTWAPEVQHGYYYDYEEQHYLFSDDSEIQYISYSGVVAGQPALSGLNEITLSGIPKIGIPIKVRQFEWDNQLGKYTTTIDLRKRVAFSGERDEDLARLTTYNATTGEIYWDRIDQTVDEFVVNYSGVLPKVILNRQYVEAVGNGVVPGDLEFVGYANGQANQQLHLQYSPVDQTMGVSVYTYITDSGPITQWTVVDTNDELVGNQVRLDYDLGILEFGDPATDTIPTAGSTVGVSYYTTLAVEYEADKTHNTVLGTEISVNPVYRRNSRGFIYLATQDSDPTNITLIANLPTLQLNSFGPLNIGNAFAAVIATVKDSQGQVLEGETVTFTITSEPVAGGFGAASFTSASTNYNGEAKAYYNPPRNINSIGENITASGWSQTLSPTDPLYAGMSQITTLRTTNLLVENNLTDIFLYEVHIDDPLQGWLDIDLGTTSAPAQLESYYTSFFDAEDIQGPTRDMGWEARHRMVWDLATPTIFAAGAGRKKVVAYLDAAALNPHTFTPGAVAPFQPVNVVNVGSGQYDVVFNTSTYSLDQPTASAGVSPSGTLYSYFLISPTTVKLKASVYNSRLNQYITSNEISIKLNIPSYLNGVWTIDAINQNHIDEISSLLTSVTASGQRVPLGFRLRSSTITLAAALDGVTFLDVNPEYNYDPYDPDTVSGVRLGHQITITSIV